MPTMEPCRRSLAQQLVEFMTQTEINLCLQAYANDQKPDKEIERSAVKNVLNSLSALAPGHSVELRIPPYAAIQLIEGPRHRRGTPGAVVETSPSILLRLASGKISWQEALTSGKLIASGERSDLSHLFPLGLSL